MNILQFLKSKFSFRKRLPIGKENYINLIDNMFHSKEALMQFIEYKTFREENLTVQSERIESNGPYTKAQLEQLFSNSEVQEAINYMIEICYGRQKSENNIDKYNTILDKHECYGLVKRIDKEEYSKKAEETYNLNVENEKNNISNYINALKKYKESNKNANRDIRIQCIALIKDLKEMGVNDGIEEKELINEIGSIDMHDDLMSGMAKVDLTIAKAQYKTNKMERNLIDDWERTKAEDERFELLLEKQKIGGKLTEEEQIFVDRKWEEIDEFIEGGTPEIYNMSNFDYEL